MGALVKFFAPALAALLIFGGCKPDKDSAQEDGLKFRFPSTEEFQVHQLREKKGEQAELVFDCKLVKSNGGFVLEWVNAKIISLGNKPVRDAVRLELSPLEAMFRHPSFRIAADGRFLETINADQVMKQSNQHLDQIFSNRSAGSRQLFDKLGEGEAGKKLLDDYYGQIWRTWVDLWIGINLPAGDSVSFEGDKRPIKAKLTHLGVVATNSQLVHLKFEEETIKKDFGPEIDQTASSVAAEIGLKKPESLPKAAIMKKKTVFEVHTDPKNLRPYWAKQSITASVKLPGQPEQTQSEVNEYRFLWTEASHPKSAQ
jgi:hypothetical protein